MQSFCYYCEREVFSHLLAPHKYLLKTTDHVIPRFNKGTNDPKNLVTACWLCNTIKANLSLKNFSKIVGDHRMKYFEIEFDGYLIIKIRHNINGLIYGVKRPEHIPSKKYKKRPNHHPRRFDNRSVSSNTSTMASRYKGETAAEFLYKRQLECDRINALNAPEENFHEPK